MCAARRATSTRLTRLAAKASPYHNAVTLYEAADSETRPGPSTRRQSSRIKHESAEPDSVLDVPDDGIEAAAQTKPGPRQRKAKTKVPDSEGFPDVSRSESPKKRKPPSKPKPIPQALDVPHPTPTRWADVYAAIKEMRSRIEAPVDTMGCDQAQLRERDPKVGRLCSELCLDAMGVDFFVVLEPTFRDPRVFDALLANQGRSDRRGSGQTQNRTWWLAFRPSHVGRG